MTNSTHFTHNLKKEVRKIEDKIFPKKKKGFFSFLKKKKLSTQRVWAIGFLVLLIVGMLSVMTLISFNSDIRNQAKVALPGDGAYGPTSTPKPAGPTPTPIKDMAPTTFPTPLPTSGQTSTCSIDSPSYSAKAGGCFIKIESKQ